MNRLKIIRSLRCANYSLSAILRMLNKLDGRIHKSESDILNILNTPEAEEDIISVCDRLTVSLEKAIKNAHFWWQPASPDLKCVEVLDFFLRGIYWL